MPLEMLWSLAFLFILNNFFFYSITSGENLGIGVFFFWVSSYNTS